MIQNLQQLQDEVKPWAEYNFNSVTKEYAWRPLVGMIEELGELEEAENNAPQKYHEEYHPRIADAMGDVMVYMAHYASCMNIQLQDIIKYDVPVPENIMVVIGRLCHAHLKADQNIRGNETHVINRNEALNYIVAYMMDLGAFYNIPFMKSVSETWEVVKQRDWKKNKETGSINV